MWNWIHTAHVEAHKLNQKCWHEYPNKFPNPVELIKKSVNTKIKYTHIHKATKVNTEKKLKINTDLTLMLINQYKLHEHATLRRNIAFFQSSSFFDSKKKSAYAKKNTHQQLVSLLGLCVCFFTLFNAWCFSGFFLRSTRLFLIRWWTLLYWHCITIIDAMHSRKEEGWGK